jgi:predicted signal transduction protein with EAL and GGDEF domain
VLIEVARRLESTMRAADTVARISGDEFAILVDEVDGEAGAEVVADRVLEAIRQPLALTGQSLIVSASLGIRVAGDEADDAQSVMRGADLAMYEAKSRGRGRWERYHRALDEHAQRRLELESELRMGIDRGEFRLLYQPVVSLRTGRMVGVEALLRWYHPTRGVISPLEFIGLAEETGLIVSLGAQVLRDAARQLAEWDRSGAYQPLHMSINLSARQLHDAAFIASVGEILRSNGLQPGRVTLEITESVLVEDGTVAVEQLTALRALGVNIAIDDFGTGYSSLSYLQRLPVDSVKIDRSFVRDVASGDRAAAFVKAIVQMCRTIELKTVAEGVETQEQVTVLRKLGCELAQGFLFAEPLNAAGIERRMTVLSRAHRAIGRRAAYVLDPQPAM